MTDDDLLRRFAALKSSSSSLTKASADPDYARHIESAERNAKREHEDLERIADGRPLDPDSTWGSTRVSRRDKEDEDGDVTRRYAALNDGTGTRWGVEELGLDGDDDDVEAFIASLSGATPSAHQPSTSPAVDNEREPDADLSKEAAELIRQMRDITQPLDREDRPSYDQAEEDGNDEEDDEETEQEILERALDEAEREADADEGGVAVRGAEPSQRTDDEEDLAFPSLPTHQPISKIDMADQADDEAEARMALLLGLSGPSTKPGGPSLPAAPTSKPASGKQPGQGWNLPGWQDGRDEDLDSWCCICNKDATVQCAGCDDDAYCDECWRDGHGVGGEQGHRARRFTWGKKGRAAQGA